MLHIVNKSPLERNALESLPAHRRARRRRAADRGRRLRAPPAAPRSRRQVNEALARFRIYALLPDLEARAVADRVIDGVATIDYAGFVDLVAQSKACQSWL